MDSGASIEKIRREYDVAIEILDQLRRRGWVTQEPYIPDWGQLSLFGDDELGLPD